MNMREIMALLESQEPTDVTDPVVQNSFRHGYCMYLALALWEMGEFTIVGTLDEEEMIDHVWAQKIGTEQIVDITGVHPIPDDLDLHNMEDRVTSLYSGTEPVVEEWAKTIIRSNPAYFGL